MSCSICLESYMDLSKTPSVDRIAYQNLANPRPYHSSTSCCFPNFRRHPSPIDEEIDWSSPPIPEGTPVATKCGHVFHIICITNWSHSPNGSRECPLCRKPIHLKNLVKLYLEPMSIIRQETTAGVLVSMSLNQYNTLKADFSLGYSQGMDKFKEDYDAGIEKVRKECLADKARGEKKLENVFKQQLEALRAEHAAKILKLESQLEEKASKKNKIITKHFSEPQSKFRHVK